MRGQKKYKNTKERSESMLDQKDMNKMHLKDSQAKKQNGAIYGTINNKTDFHLIEKMPLEGLDNKTLKDIINNLYQEQTVLLEKIKILKEVALNQSQRIENLEKVVNTYVG